MQTPVDFAIGGGFVVDAVMRPTKTRLGRGLELGRGRLRRGSARVSAAVAERRRSRADYLLNYVPVINNINTAKNGRLAGEWVGVGPQECEMLGDTQARVPCCGSCDNRK